MIRSRRSPSRSARGAARVSIIWMVSVIVLFFVALGIAYVGFEEAARADDEAQAARQQAAAADERFTADSGALTRLSRSVGWFDEEVANPRTNIDTLASELEGLKSTFADLGADVKTLSAALPAIRDAYAARGREIAQLKDQVETLKTERTTLETSLRQVIAEKDQQIADLQRQVADEAANAAQRQTELEQRIASLNQQRDDLDAQVRQLRGEMADVRRGFEDERQTWITREQATRRVLRFQQEPEAPDGRVLAVSKDLQLGWIDLGSGDRLARGMRFRVVAGRTDSDTVKAWATVTRVEPDRAEVAFSDLADRFDPVVPGDVVYNPVYDPRGQRKAVLAGRFSGRFNERELATFLENMGIEVQPELRIDSDYLIVGSELYVDENGEPLEEPLHPSDLPVYKEAEAMGVQIVPLRDLRSYFQF